MPAILHTADVHLGRSWSDLGTAGERLAALHLECFETICRLTKERGAVALVIAGDLFDKPDPPARLVEAVRAAFKRLTNAGPAVVIAPGTHDGAAELYRAGGLGGARLLLQPRIGARVVASRGRSSVAFQGLSWDPQASPKDFLSEYSRPDDGLPEVLVLHCQVGAPEGRREKDLPVRAAKLAACGADYVALGHRHEHREFLDGGRLWGAYPGTPFGLSFRSPELGPRSACLVTLGEPGGAKVERLPTTPVEWQRLVLELDGLAAPDDLLTAARREAGTERLVRLELRGSTGFVPEAGEIRAALAGDFLHVELDDDSVQVSSAQLELLAAEQSVRGIFARRMIERLGAARADADRSEMAAAIREGLRALAEEGR